MKRCCTHHHGNQRVIRPHLLICSLVPCSSKRISYRIILDFKKSLDFTIYYLYNQIPDVLCSSHRGPTSRHSKTPHRNLQLQYCHRMWSWYDRQLHLSYMVRQDEKYLILLTVIAYNHWHIDGGWCGKQQYCFLCGRFRCSRWSSCWSCCWRDIFAFERITWTPTKTIFLKYNLQASKR